MAWGKKDRPTSKNNAKGSKASDTCGQCDGSGDIAETVANATEGEKGKKRTFSSIVLKQCDNCMGYGDYYRGRA